MRNQKGITLIALVITIIVLLILAGVSIAMLTGDNGLLTKAQQSADASAVAGAKDEVTLIYQDCLAELLEDKYTNSSSTYDLKGKMAEKVNAINGKDKAHGCTVSMTDTTVTITKGSYTATGTLTATTGSEKFVWN